jgi:hypothetical protein
MSQDARRVPEVRPTNASHMEAEHDAMSQDVRRVHKELLESALDTVEENDVLKQVALRSLAGTPTDAKNTVE